MAVEESRLKQFVSVMVTRGIGLYGRDEMAKICYNSGIGLLDDNNIEWMDNSSDRNDLVRQLLINYGSRNLPAKMTAIVLARQNNIPVPEELLEKKKKKTSWIKKILK
mgnify:FL=1|jgi:hypothetical protein